MRLWLLIGACVATALLVPGLASAQSSSDPQASTPSGAIYEIPLESARRDAAPRRRSSAGARTGGEGLGGAGTRGGGSADSLYRSENNFGSSSVVPGALGSAISRAGSAKARRFADSRLHAARTSSDDPSSWGSILLLALLAGVAITTGALVVRARRRSS